MLRYNTQQKQLALPEYGRNIQQMVDYCLTIEDKNERTVCASQIIKAMRNVIGANIDSEEAERKLWDHLAIMSNFQLDIDYPYEIIHPDELNTFPSKVPYSSPSSLNFKHYGKNIEEIIAVASTMEDGDEKRELVRLIANQMKKLMINYNSEGVDDEKIFKDLLYMSKGSIVVSPDELKLHEFKTPPQINTNKKKKKK